MKKLALAIVATFAVASAALAGPSTVTLPQFDNLNVPQALANLQAFGAEPVRVDYSTTAVLGTTKAGILVAVYASSGASGGFCIAFDSASASGLGFNYGLKLISPKVLTDPLSPDANGGIKGIWVPALPVHYSNGMVLAASATDIHCLALVRPLDGTRVP